MNPLLRATGRMPTGRVFSFPAVSDSEETYAFVYTLGKADVAIAHLAAAPAETPLPVRLALFNLAAQELRGVAGIATHHMQMPSAFYDAPPFSTGTELFEELPTHEQVTERAQFLQEAYETFLRAAAPYLEHRLLGLFYVPLPEATILAFAPRTLARTG